VTNRTSERYACANGSPGRARRFCVATLRRSFGDDTRSEVIADAELIVSELITNAIDAHCGEAQLTLTVDDDTVRIEVEDDGTGLPHLADARPTDLRGRGLVIVAALSTRWGYEKLTRGKLVWAELAARSIALTSA
jgi:anti-sigma regulatory factor (Ser/Thr protein kinase)